MKRDPTLEEFEKNYFPTACRCGATMTVEEAFYLEECTHCTEEAWFDLRHWKAGGANKELDEKFGIDEKVTH